MRFTVFTPTFNRGYIIENLFRSLCRQTYRDFEWIIIDDGSTDNTFDIVMNMQKKDVFFPIIYKKISNGGKHRAFNKAVDLASGELFACVDSDDFLTDDALEIVDSIERTIPTEEKKNFAGVCGLRGSIEGKALGNTFSGAEYRDMTHLERIKNNVSGDKAEIIYTEVWRNYKFHEFEGENFLTEATALNRMASDGLKMRYFNSVIKITEYLQDGLSASSKEHFTQNPKGWGLYISQSVKYGLLTGSGKWDVIADYYYRCRKSIGIQQMSKNLNMNVFYLYFGLQLTRVRYRLHR